MNYLLKRNDANYIITYTLVNYDGSNPSLVGATVSFNVGDNTKIIFSKPATIVNAGSGIVSYAFIDADTLYDGIYKSEFVVTFADGTLLSYPRNGHITINIQKNVDTSLTNITLDAISERQGDFTNKLDSILKQAGNITMSTMNEYTWESTVGQLVYTMPVGANYDPLGKWFDVYVGGVIVPPELIDRTVQNQFTLLVSSSSILAGLTVIAKWTEPIVPVTVGHHTVHEIGGADEIDVTKLVNYQTNIATPISNNTASLVDITTNQLPLKAKQTDLSSIALIVRSSGADDTTNINTAINTVSSNGGGKVLLPDANYSALGIQLQSNVTLEGYNTIITKNGGGSTTHIVESKGSVTGTPTSLSVNASIGNTSVTVASTTGITVGNYVLVYDNNYVQSPLGRNQEIARVSAVTSTTITFATPLIGSYATASSASVVAITPVINANVKGLILKIPTGTSGGNFYGYLNVGTNVKKCEAWQPKEQSAFGFEQSALCRFIKCKAKDGQTNSTTGTSYGFYIGDSSHYCFVEDCFSENVRENPISFNVRHSGYINCQAKGCYDDGFNTHGTGNDHIYIRNCFVVGSIGQGISVGTGTQPTGDTNIFIEGNMLINSGLNGIYVTAPSAGPANRNIFIRNNKISNYGVSATNSNGILAQYSTGIFIDDNIVDGVNSTYAAYGIIATSITQLRIRKNEVYNLSNGYGVMYQVNCSDVLVERNNISSISSSNIRSSGTNTNVRIRHNASDDTLYSFTADLQEGNLWGTKKDRDKGGTSVADGGTIPHNCAAAPTSIRVTGSVASQMVSVTAVSATNFTVAIKTDAGVAGTTQTVYWEAEV